MVLIGAAVVVVGAIVVVAGAAVVVVGAAVVVVVAGAAVVVVVVGEIEYLFISSIAITYLFVNASNDPYIQGSP